MMCDVPSMAVFCKESIECCPGIIIIIIITFNGSGKVDGWISLVFL
jgi:hypothetical protein